MIFLPHTNTVILLELYCGTITEPGLPVILGASSEYPATVFKHSELILFCHSALQDVHLLAVIRESKLRGSSFQGLVSLLAGSLHFVLLNICIYHHMKTSK